MRNTVAMVLAGGRVDELSVLTIDRPKSALPFGGLFRVIDFPLSSLMYSGIARVGILSQYRPFSLMNHIGNGAAWDLCGRNRSIHVLPPFKGMHPSDWYRGTADAVYQNLDFILRYQPERVLIVSGDHIYNMDYGPMLALHRQHSADLTIAFKEVPREQAHRFGLGVIEGDGSPFGRLLQYAEKPAEPVGTWASMTIYLFNTKTLVEVMETLVGEQGKAEFGRDVIPYMLDRYAVYGYRFSGYWGYTRTIAEYYRTNMSLLGDQPAIDPDEWKIRTNLAHRDIQDRAPALIAPPAKISNSLIYNGCKIYGEVKNSILFPGVQVAGKAVVHNSIVLFDTQIRAGSAVHNAILDAGADIGEGAEVGQPVPYLLHSDLGEDNIAIVGQGVRLEPRAMVPPGGKIYPKLNGKKPINAQVMQEK